MAPLRGGAFPTVASPPSDKRSGALVVVSRYLNEHFKVGAGYNFTDFSDDLTDLSFDHRGVFLNLTGAL